MGLLSTLPWLVLVGGMVEAGYYKVRPPPPPPPPPASIHYGPHPPSSAPRYPRVPSSSAAAHYPKPPAPYYPSHHHRYAPHRSPYSSPVKAGSVRHYTRYPPPPSLQKPVYTPYAWKNGYNAYRAPSSLKESFAASPQLPAVAPATPAPYAQAPAAYAPAPPSYAPAYLRGGEDDDRGPIHTIPAPNLGPQDKPVGLFNINGDFNQKKPDHSTVHDLAAVLKHGYTKVNIQPSQGYQVTEDPSLHQPHSGGPSFFAPDPSPDLPNVKLPPTTDPHSLPSNGQVPLDLYLQQESEKHQGHQNNAVDNTNQLTAQELFNLLNYDPSNPTGLIPQAHLQQHVLQPNVQFYNPGLLLPQSQHLDAAAAQSALAAQQAYAGQGALAHHQALASQAALGHHQAIANQGALVHDGSHGQDSLGHHQEAHQQPPHTSAHTFTPQFQTFNYDERTQQGAHGSDSFPASSMNYDVQTNNANQEEKQTFEEDNDVEGSEHQDTYEKAEANEVAQPQPEPTKKFPQAKEIPVSSKSYNTERYAEPSNQYSVSTSTSYSTKSEIESQNTKSEKESSQSSANDNSRDQASRSQMPIRPEENVQLQKSIQIYENSYSTDEDLIKQEIKNLNEYSDYTDDEKLIKQMGIGQSIQMNEGRNEDNNESMQYSDDIPYGSRIRPKRF